MLLSWVWNEGRRRFVSRNGQRIALGRPLASRSVATYDGPFGPYEVVPVMIAARLIVSETSGRWAFALRTVLVNSEVSVVEVAGLAGAFGRFQDDSQTLLAFEASVTCAEEGFRLLRANGELNSGRGVIVLLDGPHAASEPLWREAGAIAVCASPRQLAPVARLIRRYFETREAPALTYREEVWQRMPWRESEL